MKFNASFITNVHRLVVCALACGTIFGYWPDASALTCRELFTKDSDAITSPEYQENIRLLQKKWSEAEIALAFGDRPLRPIERDLIDSAARVFELSGVRFRRTTHEGNAAIEVLADTPTSSRWNKMAHSIERNYSTKLIFSPIALMRLSANAAFVPSSSGSSNVILISRGSLSVGARDQAFAHEARHMAMSKRQSQSPTVFDGSIHSRNPELDRIRPEATHYPTSMQLQELATYAQDLANTARRAREPEAAVRPELESKARVVLEVVETSRLARKELEAFFRNVNSSIKGSGPALPSSASGTASFTPSLYVTKKDRTSIVLEKAGSDTWFVQLQTRVHILEVILKEPSPSVESRTDSNWDALVEKASSGDMAARKLILDSLGNEIANWSQGLEQAANALEGPARILARDARTLSLDQLHTLAMKPRHDLGPLLRRAD